MEEQYSRTIGLLGEEKFSKLRHAFVAVIGLGGVGGTALEALARSGIGKLLIIDKDIVDVSNLNRQILYTSEDVGKTKVGAAKTHLIAIAPECEVYSENLSINDDTIDELGKYKLNFIVDCIDDVKGKIAIAKYASEKNIPLIISLGMANRIDSTQVEIIRFDKTTIDPLARKLRYEYKKCGLDTSKFMSVYSKEKPLIISENLYSIMTVPSSAGLAVATYVISNLIK